MLGLAPPPLLTTGNSRLCKERTGTGTVHGGRCGYICTEVVEVSEEALNHGIPAIEVDESLGEPPDADEV